MKKVLSIVLALALVFGFAGMTFAMGPTGADPANVGLVLTSFTVSDALLSPLTIMNWGAQGSQAPTKTYAESTPIWFVASYVQNKLDANDDRNFWVGQIESLETTFTSKDSCVNYSFSTGYMNFALVSGIQVVGSTVNSTFLAASSGAAASVSTTAKELKVKMVADATVMPPSSSAGVALYNSANAADLWVCNADASVAQSYYLQIMAFTNACSEAQGTAYAKCPIDYSSFTAAALMPAADLDPLLSTTLGKPSATGNWMNLYDENNNVKYTVVRAASSALGTLNVAAGDPAYIVYDADGAVLIGFASTNKAFKGLVKVSSAAGAAGVLDVVQYTSDAGGKYVYTTSVGANATAGAEAIPKADLQKLMTFLSFDFANDYPVLEKHWEALAGYWRVLEAKYNVAAAVISTPDPGVDIVPKTGDASTAFGMIMVAIAGLAAVGFVMMKRVRG